MDIPLKPFDGFRLGRKSVLPPANAPTLRDHGILQQAAPAKLTRMGVAYAPRMFGNDNVGDCTAAMVCNAILAQASLCNYSDINITTKDALALYSAVTGYNPAVPSSDQGAVMCDMLQHQCQKGFQPNSSQEIYAGLWATLEPGDLNGLRQVTSEFGFGPIGIELALADEQLVGGVWDTGTPASYGDPTPGSAGGHCTGLWKYDGIEPTDLAYLVTWGGLQRCTWRWLQSRLVEAHALVHPQIIGSAKVNASGLDRYKLAADIVTYANQAA